MQIRYYILAVVFLLGSSLSSAAVKNKTAIKDVAEEEAVFSYASADGEFNLKCTHYLDKPETHDFDVWCGKGTPWLRTFRVHFMVRQHDKPNEGKSAFEVLYWVIDRDQKDASKKFSSGSTWISFRNPSDLERMSFSQGVENDYANLSVDYRPR
jgi:hypothetical protein